MHKARSRRVGISGAASIRVKKREGALSITSDSTVIDLWARRERYARARAHIAIVFWTEGPKGGGRRRDRGMDGRGIARILIHRGAGFSILNPIGTILSLSWCIAYATRWSTRSIDVCAFLRALRSSIRTRGYICATKTTGARLCADTNARDTTHAGCTRTHASVRRAKTQSRPRRAKTLI